MTRTRSVRLQDTNLNLSLAPMLSVVSMRPCLPLSTLAWLLGVGRNMQPQLKCFILEGLLGKTGKGVEKLDNGAGVILGRCLGRWLQPQSGYIWSVLDLCSAQARARLDVRVGWHCGLLLLLRW